MNLNIVTLVLIGIMVLITLGYKSAQDADIPCSPDYVSTLSRNFIHLDNIHLFSNMYTFYYLSQVERSMGSVPYLSLIGVLVIIQTTLEWIISNFYDLKCSIGFSGILYGLLVWYIYYYQNLNYQIFAGIFATLVTSSLQNPRLSFAGHLIGFVSGLIVVHFKQFFL